MADKRDPSPPDIARMSWGEKLTIGWHTRADSTVYLFLPPHFLTNHGPSVVQWSAHEGPGTNAVGAFHVPFPDGSRGEARHRVSTMGVVDLKRPWRRRRDNSWWPGDLEIYQDHLTWRDRDALLPLWSPQAPELERLLQGELGAHGVLHADQFHWPEFYLAMCHNAGFLAAVRDNDFTASIYRLLINHDITRLQDGHRMMSSSDRRYGDMLGAWRRCGESYLDFYSELDGTADDAHTPIIEAMFREAGYGITPAQL